MDFENSKKNFDSWNLNFLKTFKLQNLDFLEVKSELMGAEEKSTATTVWIYPNTATRDIYANTHSFSNPNPKESRLS